MQAFPYGKAPFWILVLAVVTAAIRLTTCRQRQQDPPDLVFALFARNHQEMYAKAVPAFERAYGVRVEMQLLSTRTLQSRLQAALLTGAPVPDVVEIVNPSIGFFTKGPLKDVGFTDLTQRIHEEGIYDRMVESRFSLWSSRGHIFALPHDVHPVALCYRRDLIEELGIDVSTLDTWAAFTAMGRDITRDLDGDGVPDRYALDLPLGGGTSLQILLRQKGEALFDGEGRVKFDTEGVAEVIRWFILQTRGPDRIGFGAGWGQSQAQAMLDGLVLFYFCPDWRTKVFELDVPSLAGKLALMPLPAWEPGGRRTSTWGGTGLAITKACENQDLAWAFAKFLYLQPDQLGERFLLSNILPPVKDAWDLDEFDAPSAFFSGQSIGRMLAGLALDAPDDYVSPYTNLANGKLNEAFLNAAVYYERHGDDGLDEEIRRQLKKSADYVRRVRDRNVFLKAPEDTP